MRQGLLWVLASAIGFGAGGRLGVSLSPTNDIIVTGYLAVTTSLIFVGLLQWLVLRRQIANTGRWVATSFGTVAIVGIIGFGVGLINRDVGWVLGVIVGWIAHGVLQWLVLRDTVAKAGWWVVGNMLSLLVAIPVVGVVTWALGASSDSAVGGFIRWLAFGAAYGVVTATTLSWHVRQRNELATP